MKVKGIKTTEIEIDIEVNKITLLSIVEYQKYKEKIPRISNWWWLRSPGHGSYRVAFIDDIGCIDDFGNYTFCDKCTVRPVLLGTFGEIAEFEFAGYEWIVLSENIAICKDYLTYMIFDEKSNDYEKSEVKRYLEKWLKDALREGC